jgi:hypothetical protein
MVRLWTSVLLASLLTPQTSSPRLESYKVAEAYEVYDAVISLEFPSTDANTNRLVIRAETKNSQMCLAPEEPSEKIIGSAIADYIEQNRQSRRLQRKFELEKPYSLFNENEGTPSTTPADPSVFHAVYPDFGGLIELSAVGFNADKTIAVVYYGPLCGMGEFHVLQKKADKWRPLEWQGLSCAWVS